MKTLALLGGAAWGLTLGVAHAQGTDTKEFNIEAQPLSKALLEFNEQSGVLVMAPQELVEGKAAPAIKGEMTADEALEKILAGSGLKSNASDRGAVTITLASAETVSARRFRTAQLEDSPPRQVEASADEDEDDDEPDTIIVTGTNIRGAENPTVPVLTFDKEDIDLSGAATLDDFLRTIPQNFASETQLTNDSANPNNARNNFTLGTTVDLRGLGAGATLTLLNGRRMTASGNTSNVDINILPLGLIERVDLLTDGATAVYGSDAVGGVINFITRRDFEGLDVSARYGTVTEGSKEDFALGGAGGFNWSSGGVFAGINYQEEKPLLAGERDFVDLNIVREDANFGSNMERFSVAGGVNQKVSPKARFGIDILYTDLLGKALFRNLATVSFNTSEQRAIYVNSRFEVDIADDIVASLFVDYGRTKSDTNVSDPERMLIARNNFKNENIVYEGQVSGRLAELPGGVVSFSVGGLYREEDYFRTGVTIFPAIDLFFERDPVEGKRNVTAGYAELLAPIFGAANAMPFVQRLDLSIAARYENYSDFGDSFDPKIGLYWEVTERLSLRASYTEAFRAPDLESFNQLQQVFVTAKPTSLFTAVTPPAPGGVNLPSGIPGVITLSAQGGNPDLGPESATSWSAGFSYEPKFIQGLSVGGNYFTIDYRDRLEQVGVDQPLQDPAFRTLLDIPPNLAEVQDIFTRGNAGEFIFFNGTDASTPEEIQAFLRTGFQNLARRKVSGFDLNVNYTKEADFGNFTAGVNMSYLFEHIAQLTELSPVSEQIDTLYRPVDFRLNGSLSWSRDGFTTSANVNYTDGYRDNINPDIANRIDSWTIIGLSLAYSTQDRFDNIFIDGTRFGFSVTNLFDEDPPFVATFDGLNFDTANANPFGRQVSFTISKSF